MQSAHHEHIDRYTIEYVLGEGGMARVYLAKDTRLNRPVALKLIRKEMFSEIAMQEMRRRFDREAQSLARLAHPNIVKLFDYGEHNGAPYLVLEYLSGGTLRDRVGKPLSCVEAASILTPIARALDYAQQQGIIHRDIKPSNILLSASGDPHLSDFGIIKLVEGAPATSLTTSGVTIGTPEYMAPEQGLGKSVDGRADIYALGVVFYELLTGRRPFSADTPMQVLFKHVSEPLPDPRQLVPDLPVNVVDVLQKALAKQPENRYGNMAELGNELAGIAGIPVTQTLHNGSFQATAALPGDPTRPEPPPLENALFDKDPLATRTPESLLAIKPESQENTGVQSAPKRTAFQMPAPSQPSKARKNGKTKWLWSLPVVLFVFLVVWGLSQMGSHPLILPPETRLPGETIIVTTITQVPTTQMITPTVSPENPDATNQSEFLPSETTPSPTPTSSRTLRPTDTLSPTATPSPPNSPRPTATKVPVQKTSTATPLPNTPTATYTPFPPTATYIPMDMDIQMSTIKNGSSSTVFFPGDAIQYIFVVSNNTDTEFITVINAQAFGPCSNTIMNQTWSSVIIGPKSLPSGVVTHQIDAAIPASACSGTYTYKVTISSYGVPSISQSMQFTVTTP